jgi:Aminoglycoside-2''-adenylyltransferase
MAACMCNRDAVQDEAQLRALADLHELLDGDGIEYWLFGGWAVDFHARGVSRVHDDLDIAVWAADRVRVASLLSGAGWRVEVDESAHGYVVYVRSAVRLEVAFLARGSRGDVYTPLADGRASWPDGAFGDDVREMGGVRARVIGRAALVAEKSEVRGDPAVAAKDRADLETLERPSC